jgi:hypothetical protein
MNVVVSRCMTGWDDSATILQTATSSEKGSEELEYPQDETGGMISYLRSEFRGLYLATKSFAASGDVIREW